MSNEANVVAVIVTYNPDLDKLKTLICSIITQVYKLVIVDNGSSNSEEIFELYSKYCELFLLGENYGIASAQNIGIKESFKLNASHVLLFDQDTLPPSNFVVNLLDEERKLLANGYKVGAIGPSFHDGRTKVAYPAALINGFSLEKIYPDNYKDPISVSFIIASGTLIRTSILKKVGLMLDYLFIDYVDIEWCLRAISNGFNIYICPSVRIHHDIGDSRKRVFNVEHSLHNHIRCYYIARNGFLIARLNTIPFLFKVRTVTYSVFRNVFTAALGRDFKKNIKFTILGVIHGVVNRKGKLYL